MKLEKIDLLSADKLKHYQKGTYSGSHCGMRYLVKSGQGEDEERQLVLCVWPEPYCFDKTPEEKKEYFRFPFSEDGLKQAEDTLNRIYSEKDTLWEEKNGISTLTL